MPSYSVNDVWLAHKHLPNFAEVERAAKDTFEYLPSKYLDGYRNPCWCVCSPLRRQAVAGRWSGHREGLRPGHAALPDRAHAVKGPTWSVSREHVRFALFVMVQHGVKPLGISRISRARSPFGLWCRRERDGQLKCLPYFQILGVSKCGTTDLYHRLTEHPDMAKSGWKVSQPGRA